MNFPLRLIQLLKQEEFVTGPLLTDNGLSRTPGPQSGAPQYTLVAEHGYGFSLCNTEKPNSQAISTNDFNFCPKFHPNRLT